MSDTPQARGRKGTGPWEALERWRSTAFLVGGTWLLGFVAVNGVDAFTSMTPPRVASVLFVAPGLVAGHLGLLGLVPGLRDRVPRQALVGAVVVGVAAVTTVVLLLAGVGNSVAGERAPFRAVEGLAYVLALSTTILGYVLVGTGSLRAGERPRTVGLVLLGPPAVFLVMVAGLVTGFTPEWSTFLVSAMQAGAHLAIGVTLRRSEGRTARAEPTPDSVA